MGRGLSVEITEAINLALWWAEGTKARIDKRWKDTNIYSVEITNLNYLRNKLNVQNQKIRLQLQIHQGDDIEELERYWENETGIPRNQFNKTIIRPAGNKIGKSKGTCKIRVHDKKLHIQLLALLKKMQELIK